jgi:UDP-galactopyranose mutase
MSRHLVVGAGFSGAVLARCLAEAGHNCLVVDERLHVAGNCHTDEDEETGILVHRYGPHIFHTDDDAVLRFIQRFGQWVPYRHAVFAQTRGKVFSLPVNLLTINQFFGTAMDPAQARTFLEARTLPISKPASFREQALASVGKELYEAFFRHYTVKQWGIEPDMLPASVLKRLPVRFSYDNSYFHHQTQAMPQDGYTDIVRAMLDHDGIEIRLGLQAEALAEDFAHTFYTGGLDRYFGYRLGRLAYRTLRFEELRLSGDALGCPVMNFPDRDVPWTRMTEHRHLSPWRRPKNGTTIVWREYSEPAGPGSTPFYPLRLAGDEQLLEAYCNLARNTSGVTFLGRLGSYAYIDMDVAIRRALDTASAALRAFRTGIAPPTFVYDPLQKA